MWLSSFGHLVLGGLTPGLSLGALLPPLLLVLAVLLTLWFTDNTTVPDKFAATLAAVVVTGTRGLLLLPLITVFTRLLDGGALLTHGFPFATTLVVAVPLAPWLLADCARPQAFVFVYSDYLSV